MAKAAPELTARQRQILEFISRTLKSKGVPPSIREIGKAVSLSSPSSVYGQLKKLERLGLLTRFPALSRSIRLRKAPVRETDKEKGPTVLPLVRSLLAPPHLLDEHNIAGRHPVPFAFADGVEGFLMTMASETLRDIAILPGDTLAVSVKEAYAPGEIVVALVDGESTVQRFFPSGSAVRLEPENRRMRPLFVRDPVILGSVVGVIRTL